MAKIIFVGSNPSQRSSSVVPFWHDTKSTKTIRHWLNLVGNVQFDYIQFLNVSNSPTPNNRPLKMSEIKTNLQNLKDSIYDEHFDIKIVALGKTAEKALTLLGLDFYAMPHPSGLNRKLNDPNYVEEKIKGLSLYLSPFKNANL